MKLDSILTHIRRMRDLDGVRKIVNAAEARDSKLSNIDIERERKRLWDKVGRLELRKGDTVFIHTPARSRDEKARVRIIKPNGKPGWKTVVRHVTPSGQHAKLWGHALTVHEIKPRSKEVVVRIPGSAIDHRLSPHTCDRLKLSKEPTPEALSNALKGSQ